MRELTGSRRRHALARNCRCWPCRWNRVRIPSIYRLLLYIVNFCAKTRSPQYDGVIVVDTFCLPTYTLAITFLFIADGTCAAFIHIYPQLSEFLIFTSHLSFFLTRINQSVYALSYKTNSPLVYSHHQSKVYTFLTTFIALLSIFHAWYCPFRSHRTRICDESKLLDWLFFRNDTY